MVASHKQLLKRLGALTALDSVIFGASNAVTAPSWLIMIGFITLSLTLYYLTYSVISGAALYGVAVKRKKTFSLYVTIVLALLLALQSAGQLGSRDIWVLFPLVLIGYFYNAYAKAERA